MRGGAGDDVLRGQRDDYAMSGGGGDDLLRGNHRADDLRCGRGADVITGGPGADVLTGGAGTDLFDFNAIRDSVRGETDWITDFTPGREVIDLRGIDVGSDQSGDQAFVWTGRAAFKADGTGQLRAQIRGADTILLMDHDGDGRGDLAIWLTGLQGLDASDIIL